MSTPMDETSRRLRQVVVLAVYLLLACVVGIGALARTQDAVQAAASLFFSPLFAACGALLAAPRACASFEPRALLRPLVAAGTCGAIGAYLVLLVVNVDAEEGFALDLLYALRRPSVAGALLAFALGVVASAPLVLVRYWNGQLEWQVGAGLVGGLVAVLFLGVDVVGDSAVLLLTATPLGVLGAGSFLADRWAGGRLDARAATGPGVGIAVLSLLLVVPVASLFQAVGRSMAAFEPTRIVALEEALEDCRDALNRARDGVAQLPDLPGVDPELAAGLKEGYVIRFGAWKDGWTLAADPQGDADLAHYRLRSSQGGALEVATRPLALTP